MQKRLFLNKLIAVLGIAMCLVPAVLTPIIAAQEENSSVIITPNDVFFSEKPRRMILYRKGMLGNVISADTYHMRLKGGAQYLFWARIKIDAGWFGLSVSGPGGSHVESPAWDTNDPASDKKIVFSWTPSDSGDHQVVVGTFVATDGGTYRIYVNKTGFAGFWWMILAGVGVIAILIVVIVLLKKILS